VWEIYGVVFRDVLPAGRYAPPAAISAGEEKGDDDG
jgi:hypothetical protein